MLLYNGFCYRYHLTKIGMKITGVVKGRQSVMPDTQLVRITLQSFKMVQGNVSTMFVLKGK